ncbi:conserved hypothetical protein [Gluconacetobacter diazotrophicus PA1 5]|nr:hypothetical protein [Gluconacetobacter diazotrophicus]ACI51644.1 conserved hypothetical protein [Gluconacetobacter diazotrophicus PA1 5]MBB2155323.1 hypothetical protein [Gluconacetobacter diazotrophicus]TWB10988.1 hypothetical protein FBZ86_10111 [Gluconacetobacter diazotrophicus]
MSHNYATPMTPERRLARLLSRIPDDRIVRIEKTADPHGALRWRAAIGGADAAPGDAPDWSAFCDTMPDALEAAWRAVRGAGP